MKERGLKDTIFSGCTKLSYQALFPKVNTGVGIDDNTMTPVVNRILLLRNFFLQEDQSHPIFLKRMILRPKFVS